MNPHRLIDQFVEMMRPLIPEIRLLDDAPWIQLFENRLSRRLPVSFGSFVSRYAFPAFEVGDLALFANTGKEEPEDMVVAVFRDKPIAAATSDRGYIHFARPSTGSYDPVCFDVNERAKNHEYPIVRIDHEEILCNNRIVIKERIAHSFYRFVLEQVQKP